MGVQKPCDSDKDFTLFWKTQIAEIEAKDVIAWQNELMAYRDEKGKPYSADYLRTIRAQLTAIFNHAVNFYNLPYNLARREGTIGSEAVKEMDFWTKECFRSQNLILAMKWSVERSRQE